MVNRRMKAQAALSLARRAARRNDLTVTELPGRGKGSHRMYAVLDLAGKEVARFGLTHHSADTSWTVLRQLESQLAPLFGDRWMEKR
ncbi:MAG: hypothetical protein ACRDT2_06720 [Natronosporangium sp.]